jgi:hypothetical protein
MRLTHDTAPSRATEGRRTAAFVLYMLCPWKLSHRGAPVCSWEDDRSTMESGLGRLPGLTVAGVDTLGSGPGVEVNFGDELTLHVVPEPEPYLDEYEFLTPERRYTIFADGRIVQEQRESLAEL